MSKRIRHLSVRLAVAALALGAVAGGGVVVANAASGTGRADLVVFEPESGGIATYFDLADGAADADPLTEIGDLALEHKPLVDPESGAEVGKAVTRVQVLDVSGGDPVFNIDCTIALAEGDIVFYGAGRFSELAVGATFAVTGGTGRYAGTRGTVTIRGDSLDGTSGFTIAFDLTRR